MKKYIKIILVVTIAFALFGCSGISIPQATATPLAVSPVALPTSTPFGTVPLPLPTQTNLVDAATANLPTPTVQKPVATKAVPTPSAALSAVDKAMQRDIDLLKQDSTGQQGNDANYKNMKKETIVVERVSTAEIKFVGKTQVFKGNYTGQFTAGKSYSYFPDASMGGKRYYNVKDNFGVWITFKYQEPF